jgi:hydroxymethylpyrimidine pyrophosphatase-like HAD family hydrolase
VILALKKFLRHKHVHFACYYPLAGGTYDVYSHDEDYVRGRYGAIMGYVTSHFDEFFDRMLKKGATRFVIKKHSHHDFEFPQNFPACVAPNEGVFEITMPDVHKGAMVSNLADYLGINMDEIGIAGNGYNDIDFFKYADVPLKIQVGDECPELATWATDYVVDAVELACFLEDRYLKK